MGRASHGGGRRGQEKTSSDLGRVVIRAWVGGTTWLQTNRNTTMAARNRITTTILSTLIAGTALLGGAQSATASVPDPVSTIGLRALAAEFGDSFGHIVSTDANGQPVVLARLVRVYEVYTAGDQIYVNDQFALCHEDQAGGLSSCEPLDPGLGDYTCGWNEIQSWCSCEGFYDCFDMITSGPCDEGTIVCDGQGCECDA